MQHKTLMAASLIAAAASVQAEVVYSNTNSYLNQNFNAGTLEIGDELNLAGTGRQLSAFDFQYFGINLDGNEQAQVRIYANDGLPPIGNSLANKPGTVLWDSGLFNVGNSTGSRLNWSVALGNLPANVVLPNRITFSVKFTNIDAGDSAGVALYDPPTTGFSVRDFWENTDGLGDWRLQTNATFVMNFGSSVQAVPEPSFWALAIAGGLCGFFLMRRRTAQK